MSEKKTTGQFKESESGLCNVSFDEGVPAGLWKCHLHYVPLIALLVGACAAIGVGTWYKVTHPAPQVPTPVIQASSFACTTPQSPPEVCVLIPRADVGSWMPGVTGMVGYLPMDAAQASFEQSTIGVTTYVQGRDDYLFPSDIFNANFSQALGRVRLTPEQVSAWDRYTSGIETAMSEQGATALLMPAPATWDIYFDKLPQWTDPLMGTIPLDLMCPAPPTRAWVDVHEGLREACEGSEAPLRSTVSPHWLLYAAHVAWNQMLSYLAAVNPRFEGLPPLMPSGASSVDAPNECEVLGAPVQSGPWAAPTYEQDPGSVHLLQLGTRDDLADIAACLAEVTGTPEVSLAGPVDFQNKPALTYSPNGCSTAFIVRDSQGSNLGLGVAVISEYMVQVGHGFDTEQPTDVAALIEVYKPSVVIVEFTLRYLVLTSAAGKQNRFPDHDRSDGSSRA